MSLPDTPLIAGAPGQYALIQRISGAGSVGGSNIAAGGLATSAATIATIPILTGQGIQIRDVGVQVQDRLATGLLMALSLSIVLVITGGANDNVPICIRGSGPGDHTVGGATDVNLSDFSGPAWGSQDWPFISAGDFTALQGTLAPKLTLRANSVIRNTDAAIRACTYQFSFIYEVWQAFAGSLSRTGHVGY